MLLEKLTGSFIPALSALFKVDGALRRVGGENDYIYYAGNHRIHKILTKVAGALGMSSWRHAPSLADNQHCPHISK